MAKIKQLKDKSGTEQIFPKTKTQAIYNTDGTLLSETLDDLYGSLATIETSPTTTSHSVGEYILYEGQVYKVTSVIASGDSLVVGTNISAVNLGDQISTLNSNLTLSPLTLTRTENNYVNATDFNRIAAYKYGGLVLVFLNLLISSSMASGTTDVLIGKINNISLQRDYFFTIPSQANNSTLLFILKQNGDLAITNLSGTATGSTFFRGSLVAW